MTIDIIREYIALYLCIDDKTVRDQRLENSLTQIEMNERWIASYMIIDSQW